MKDHFTKDENYMQYCMNLAMNGLGSVSPNPLVGSLIVYNNHVIGQGFHKKFGGPHAEIEAIQNVSSKYKHLIPKSTLYVNLEPCNHFGKTPPCTDAILSQNISKVVFGCYDPNPQMSGKSIQILKERGIQVEGPILEQKTQELNSAYIKNVKTQKPFVIVKFAQSGDFFMGKTSHRVKISSETTDLLVHKWRSECDGILIGKNTALTDDPLLTNRFMPGKNPLRIILDRSDTLPMHLRIFNAEAPTLTFSDLHVDKSATWHEILQALYKQNIAILMVEGGAEIINSLNNEGEWDEAKIITSSTVFLNDGLKAPSLTGRLKDTLILGDDTICYLGRN
ncbi:MAG: bifunctional diaminohydroxyphosphoribosylaminopyrimidine deaminase/5-amino-6-(5-phosphoribosylamino)uracil reductase RibD [Bacteroidota bacterium]|nr:bifunctional diaminohydroxyphosphoribosylaminopyrimidine deaminase/5-amino-6-(5-phosphoribosylamino)uracil reductase RibD [Bacteroidota bacterium]